MDFEKLRGLGYTIPTCPSCARAIEDGEAAANPAGQRTCIWCGQNFADGVFFAHGTEAMKHQVAIVNYHHKMEAIKNAVGYGCSALFIAVSSLLIGFAPESRTTAANLVAGALLVIAAGIAGFTRLRAKAPGIDIAASGRSRSN